MAGEKSENGWPVITSTACTTFTLGGIKWYAATKDLAFLAKYLILCFDKLVEPIEFPGEKTRDDWSWAPLRTVRGSTAKYSNHCSATAWDLNATRHPRGVAVTRNLNDAQIAQIGRITGWITSHNGTRIFEWGGGYKTPDGMHFAVRSGVTKKQISEAVSRLKSIGVK